MRFTASILKAIVSITDALAISRQAHSAAIRRFKAQQRAADALSQVEGWQTLSPAALARALNSLGVPTASGRGQWDDTKAWRAKQLATA